MLPFYVGPLNLLPHMAFKLARAKVIPWDLALIAKDGNKDTINEDFIKWTGL